jgi:hypothetical protein
VAFGGLSVFVPALARSPVEITWFLLRLVLIAIVVLLWLLRRSQALFRAIIVANIFLTAGLLVSTATLVGLLFGFTARGVGDLLRDVSLIASANILIFSIWYWLIDPPGIDEDRPSQQAWDFLFSQRAAELPQYRHWTPRYTDYLFLAFTTTVAFSPTDTLPLSRRAKLLMMLQATISVVIVVVVVGTAVNAL